MGFTNLAAETPYDRKQYKHDIIWIRDYVAFAATTDVHIL